MTDQYRNSKTKGRILILCTAILYGLAGVCVKSISSLHEFTVRANGLHILLCSLTISYFHDFGLSLWLCLFMFLYETDTEYVIAKRHQDEIRIQKIMKRYRSLSV